MPQPTQVFTDSKRLTLIRIVLGLSLLVGLLLSFELWGSQRFYPLVPMIEGLSFAFLEPYLRTLLILFSIAVVVGIKPKHSLTALSAFCVLAVLSDLNRLQPWMYQYIFLSVALSFYYFKPPQDANSKITLNACRAIFCGIYIYAGLQKLNVSFFHRSLPWLVSPYVDISQAPREAIGIFAAFSEMSIGIFLLFPRLRNFGIGMAVLMHGLLLLCLGPLGHNRNSIVWPWNISMPAFVFLLFHNSAASSLREIIRPRGMVHASIIAAFLFLPSLNVFGMWDSYLSFKIYSGNTQSARIIFVPEDMSKLPLDLQNQIRGNDISLSRWSLDTNNVPAYPAQRYYVGVMKNLCAHLGSDSKTTLKISDSPNWRTGRSESYSHSCSELMNSFSNRTPTSDRFSQVQY